MKKYIRRTIYLLSALAIIALVVYSLLPSPIVVDTVRAQRNHMMATVNEEGEARVRDRYVIAAPITGRLERIKLRDGDTVKRGSLVASILPAPVEPQRKEEIIARIQNAEALKNEADQRVEHARADYEQSQRECDRAEQLSKDGLVSTQTLEQARNAETTSKQELDAAKFRAAAVASELKGAKAGLIAIEASERPSQKAVKLISPVHGRVLQVVEKSERVVLQGSPVLIIGDSAKIEIVVDVLSTDAVKIRPGMKMLVEGWGGDYVLTARVRSVEAAAVTKVSALGIEEQRVNVIADFIDKPQQLGDGYRLQVQIVTWEAENVLTVPLSAVFRQGDDWKVFVIEGGKAKIRPVEIGHRSNFQIEISKGLEVGEQVISYPSNDLKEGMAVEVR